MSSSACGGRGVQTSLSRCAVFLVDELSSLTDERGSCVGDVVQTLGASSLVSMSDVTSLLSLGAFA